MTDKLTIGSTDHARAARPGALDRLRAATAIVDADGGPGFSQDAGGVANKCTPMSCKQLGYNCGVNADGCGGTNDCGACPATQLCGVGGGYSQCADPTLLPDGGRVCVPKKCSDLGYDCGMIGDGCGGTLDCGPTSCPAKRSLKA